MDELKLFSSKIYIFIVFRFRNDKIISGKCYTNNMKYNIGDKYILVTVFKLINAVRTAWLNNILLLCSFYYC